MNPPSAAGAAPLTIVGCGILRKEVDYLIRNNGWVVETHYLHLISPPPLKPSPVLLICH